MAISYGSRGVAVSALQSQLKKAVGLPVVIDGLYGKDTQEAVDLAYVRLSVPGQSGRASDELIGVLAATVGPGNTPINQTPPKGASAQGAEVTSTWGMDFSVSKLSTPVKVALAGVGAVVLLSMFGGKK